MRSYWRRVCGCIPASWAATEISSTLSVGSMVVISVSPQFVEMLAPGLRGERGEFLQRLAGLGRELLRHDDLHRDEEIALAAIAFGHPTAAHAKHASTGCIRRHPDLDQTFQCGYS